MTGKFVSYSALTKKNKPADNRPAPLSRPGDKRPWRAWYSNRLWLGLRRHQLSVQPLCEMCLKQGRTSLATVVDHITPHRGNWELFKDPGNLQSLDKQCHDSVKQRMEKRGLSDLGGDVDGMPLDRSHHWNVG